MTPDEAGRYFDIMDNDGSGKLAKEEAALTQTREEAFWELCRQHPKLVSRADAASSAALSDEEKADMKRERLERIRRTAEEHLRAIESYTDEERAFYANQGDLELYTEEAIWARDSIREDPDVIRLLSRWWIAARRFNDKDKNYYLDADEYRSFYRLLLKFMDPDNEMSTADRERVMHNDMMKDMGHDGMV